MTATPYVSCDGMKIATVESTAWQKRLQTHDFTFSQWDIRAYPDPDDYLYPFFYPGGAKNFGAVDDQKLTDLILEQRQAPDTESREQVVQEIDHRWNEEFAYFLWTIEPPFAHAFSNRVRNPLDYAGLASTFLPSH